MRCLRTASKRPLTALSTPRRPSVNLVVNHRAQLRMTKTGRTSKVSRHHARDRYSRHFKQYAEALGLYPENDDANNPQAQIHYENKRYVACRDKCMDLLRQRNLPPLTRCLTLQLLASCSYYHGAKTALEQALKIASQVCALFRQRSYLTRFSWEGRIRMGTYERMLRSCWKNLSSIVQSLANPVFTSRSSRRMIVERLGVVCNMVMIIEYGHFGSGGRRSGLAAGGAMACWWIGTSTRSVRYASFLPLLEG